jgi:ribonuclease P protein component
VKKLTLQKKTIIKKNSEFNELFTKGKFFSSIFFKAYSLPCTSVKIGFTTQRGLKTKPQRNRIKRITRELWRKNFPNYRLDAKIVITAKAKILNANHLTLEKDFNDLLKQL